MTFGRELAQELVVLLTKPSMFGKFLVHAWRWYGGSNKEHSISVHGGSKKYFIAWHAKMSLTLHEPI
jgi:hypothetical protein